MRRCKTCGANLDHRPRAAFCGAACRVRYHRAKQAGKVSELPRSASADPSPGEDLMTMEELARYLQSAIRSATPSSLPPLVSQYRATLQAIERGSIPVGDEVDELLQRRAERA